MKQILIVLFLALFLVGCRHVPVQVQQGNVVQQESEVVVEGRFEKGKRAPRIVVESFSGEQVDISQFYGKKAVVLDFWAAWCPYCVNEMPELQRAADKYKDDLVMIGVHRTETESVEIGEKFARERGVSYVLVKDDGSLYKAVGGVGMPVAVYIDKTGMVGKIKSGPKTVEEIAEQVGGLMR